MLQCPFKDDQRRDAAFVCTTDELNFASRDTPTRLFVLRGGILYRGTSILNGQTFFLSPLHIYALLCSSSFMTCNCWESEPLVLTNACAAASYGRASTVPFVGTSVRREVPAAKDDDRAYRRSAPATRRPCRAFFRRWLEHARRFYRVFVRKQLSSCRNRLHHAVFHHARSSHHLCYRCNCLSASTPYSSQRGVSTVRP